MPASSFLSIHLSPVAFWSSWLTAPPHHLCTGCSLCLEHSSPRYLQGFLLHHFNNFAQMSSFSVANHPSTPSKTAIPSRASADPLLFAPPYFSLCLSPSNTQFAYLLCSLSVSLLSHVCFSRVGICIALIHRCTPRAENSTWQRKVFHKRSVEWMNEQMWCLCNPRTFSGPETEHTE